jgi:hypothetical protein
MSRVPTAPITITSPNTNRIIYTPLLLNAAISVVNVSLAITTKSASRRPTSAGNATTITINSIHFNILISLSSQHVCSKVFPLFVAGTNLCHSNQSTETNLFGFLAYLTNKSQCICLNSGIVLW